MTELSEAQQRTLALGLAAFDAAARGRRRRRMLVRGAAAVMVMVACLVVGERLVRRSSPSPGNLPAYVEIIRSDLQLGAELQLANACERVERTDGHLAVVECTSP